MHHQAAVGRTGFHRRFLPRSLLRRRHVRSPIGTRNAVRTCSAIGVRTYYSAIGIRNAVRTRSAIEACSAGICNAARTHNAIGTYDAIEPRKKERPRCTTEAVVETRSWGNPPPQAIIRNRRTSCRIPLDYPIHTPLDAKKYHVPLILCQPVAMRPESLK